MIIQLQSLLYMGSPALPRCLDLERPLENDSATYFSRLFPK